MNTYVIIYITGKQWNKITVRCESHALMNTLDRLLFVLVHPPHISIHSKCFSILVNGTLSLKLQSWSSNHKQYRKHSPPTIYFQIFIVEEIFCYLLLSVDFYAMVSSILFKVIVRLSSIYWNVQGLKEPPKPSFANTLIWSLSAAASYWFLPNFLKT